MVIALAKTVDPRAIRIITPGLDCDVTVSTRFTKDIVRWYAFWGGDVPPLRACDYALESILAIRADVDPDAKAIRFPRNAPELWPKLNIEQRVDRKPDARQADGQGGVRPRRLGYPLDSFDEIVRSVTAQRDKLIAQLRVEYGN